MTNLLAILVSLAMLLTGATAPVAAPVSRTLELSNFTVRHNDEEVTLSPYASLGVMTDGAKAVVDFFIGKGDNIYLPFQVSANEDGLLVLNDNAEVTLKIDADQIDEMMGGVTMDEDSKAVFTLLGDYMGACTELIRLGGDPDAMREIQVQTDAIYDAMVDRGESEVGSVEYDDETFQVDIYEYDLTASQLGALIDAVYASNERLTNYAEVYFRLLAAMPEDSGLNGFDSYEALLKNFEDYLTMHVTESIAEDVLNVSDIILRFAVPEMEEPLEFVVHSVKYGEDKTSEVTANIDVDGTAASLYIEAEQSGNDMEMDLTMTLNPADAGIIGEGDESTGIIAEAYDEDEDDDDYEDDDLDDEIALGGEGDVEDAVYFNMDFDRSYDEVSQSYNRSIGYNLDIAERKLHMELAIEGDGDEYQVAGEADVGEDSYGFEFTAIISDDDIDERIEADEAVSMDEFDPTGLVASVSADAMNLYGDASVQQLIAMAQSAMETASSVEPLDIDGDVSEPEDEPDTHESDTYEDAGVDISEEVANEIEDAAAEAYAAPFGTPHFGWLPEGYALQEVNVDDEYQFASCTIVNEETYDSIYIDIASVMSYAESHENYILGEDGSLTPVDGLVLNAEVGDSYSVYTMNDGKLSYNVYRGSDAVTTEDIAHILYALTLD